MAEYYPLLAKAIGSLPNSTPETRRVVYERARKALIGQLRTLHPPVPDEDIEHESVELDRAVERLESELANVTPLVAAPAALEPPPKPSKPPVPPAGAGTSGSLGPPARKPQAPLRTKSAIPSTVSPPTPPSALAVPEPVPPTPIAPAAPASEPVVSAAPLVDMPPISGDGKRPRAIAGEDGKPRLEPQRPIAPQPVVPSGPKRPIWIIFVAVGFVVAAVAFAAWKLRDRPEAIVAAKPAPQAQDTGKIAERVGDASSSPASDDKPAAIVAAPAPSAPPQQESTPADQAAPAASNPELPIAHRAALLVEAPNETNKVKTFVGTVVWKLNNVSAGPSDAVGVAVEADIDLPEDKTKAVVTFEKNTDSSLPASHTIKIHFIVQPDSTTGDVKQISVPQMRREDSPSGEPLAGVTVPVVQNTFLVGLSPGNAETANLELIGQLQWIDIPMLLTSGKIAKLTFEKSDSGQRDIAEAIAAWQKQ